MPELLTLGSSIIGRVERTTEVVANNIANLTTPGYSSRSFRSELSGVSYPDQGAGGLDVTTGVDVSGGKVYPTHAPLDLAVEGSGAIVMSGPTGLAYAKCVQLTIGPDGTLRSQDGYVLQSVHGGEISVKSQNPQFMPDGRVIDNGELVGQIAIVDFIQRGEVRPGPGSLLVTPAANTEPAATGKLLSGYLVASNVETGHEMVNLLAAIRDAQAGQRLVQTYDELIGRAISSFA